MTPSKYLDMMKSLMDKIDADAASDAAWLLYNTVKSGRSIFVAGNGGSAATANHFAADFGKNVVLADEGRPRVMSLCCNMSSVTAYANDEGYENAFYRQLTKWAESDDVLVVISASGNSPSVVKAAEFMHSRGGKVIAMTGFSGGKLRLIADICLHADDDHYETVEDAHSVFCHMIVSCIKAELAQKG
jgi:D-sedoheptulose 7-phosphate isomerase